VHFDLNDYSGSTPTCTLTLTNTSDEIVAFKIKTTSPKRYWVKPNQELLLAGASISVTFVLHAKEALAMVEQPLSTIDKFLIATVLADEAFVSAINAARSSSVEFQRVFITKWAMTDKTDIMNQRLNCTFSLSETDPTELGDGSLDERDSVYRGKVKVE